MGDTSALQVAVQLLHMPGGVRLVRKRQLPAGMLLLLRIAARDAGPLAQASTRSERDSETLVRAARFFVEQILLAPEADSFRVLGCTPQSDASELKRSMSLLMSWLHPDAAREPVHAAFAVRVTSAWNDVKTKDRRLAYAQSLAARQPLERDARQRHRTRRTAIHPRPTPRPSLLRQMLAFFIGPHKA